MNHKITICFLLMPMFVFAQTAATSDTIVSSSPAQEIAVDKPKLNNFNLNLNLLARGEIRDGGFPNDPNAENPTDRSAFVFGRGRLTLGYNRQRAADCERPLFETKISLQYVGVWGQESTNTFNLYEAWARLNSKQGLFLQFGRLALAYDDERVVGPNDWTMAGNTHDALRLGYEGRGHKLHILGAYNQNLANMNAGTTFFSHGDIPYKTMQMLWYHYDLPVFPLSFSALGMNIGMQGGEKGVDEHMEWQQMLGGYLKLGSDSPMQYPYTPDNAPEFSWMIEGSYYHQLGRNEYHAKINAFMASAKATIKPSHLYGFELGYDYLSGDDYVAVLFPNTIGLPYHAVIKGFNPVFGSHHKFYGAMDFFYVSTFVNDFSPGLQNAYFGAFVNPVKGLNIKTSYHYMAVTTDLNDRNGPLNKTLGHMAEVELSYQIIKEVKLSAGFTYMGGTETMARLKRASSDGRMYWGWFSIVATPTLVKVKW